MWTYCRILPEYIATHELIMGSVISSNESGMASIYVAKIFSFNFSFQSR